MSQLDAEYFIRYTEENKKRTYIDDEGQEKYIEKMFDFGCHLLRRRLVLTYDQFQEYFKWMKAEEAATDHQPSIG